MQLKYILLLVPGLTFCVASFASQLLNSIHSHLQDVVKTKATFFTWFQLLIVHVSHLRSLSSFLIFAKFNTASKNVMKDLQIMHQFHNTAVISVSEIQSQVISEHIVEFNIFRLVPLM